MMPLPFKTKKAGMKASVSTMVLGHWSYFYSFCLSLKSYQIFLPLNHKENQQWQEQKILPVS